MENSKSTGIGIFGVIQIVLIILKLFNVINISWGAVFIPTYISLALIVIVLLILLIFAILAKG